MKLHKIFAAGWIGDGIALLAGLILTLAFAPYHLSLIAILSPALLLATWLNVTRMRAQGRGFLFGLGFFSTGIYWVYNSIHTFGHASVFFSGLITVGFIIILALFPAANGWLLNRYFPLNKPTKILFAFPAIWVFLEWMRGFIFTGFPWLLLGYSQVHSPLKGYAPIVSVYGVSLITLISSSLLLTICLQRKKRNVIFYNTIALFSIWIVGGVLSHIHWTSPHNAPIQVSLIQGNIPQAVKWSPDQVQPTLDKYVSLTNAHWDSKLIIWPEGAIPVTLQDATGFIDQMTVAAKEHHTTVITGIPVKVPEAEGYYNAVIATGEGTGVYLKRRLVPFGEYMPVPNLLRQWLNQYVEVPMSDFIRGPKLPKPIFAANENISAFICYEIAYAELVYTQNPDIGIILTVSNDAWFGQSIAQAQHLQIAEMRALELQRPVLFVANSGITAILNSAGNIQSSVPPYETAVLTDMVQAMTGKTPWQRFSMGPVFLLLLVFIVLAKRTNR